MDGEVERGFSIGNIVAVDDRGDFIVLNLGGEGFILGVDFGGFRDDGDKRVEGGALAI